MASKSVAELANWIQEHQFLTPQQSEELAALNLSRFTEPQALLRELFIRGWLTKYQVHKIQNDQGGQLRVGPYCILDRLGSGGMGDVFRARHLFMDRVVALKLINREWLESPKSVGRFMQETRAAGQLLHPNIVIAHDANEVNGTYFFAMEYIEGIDLARLVAKSGPLPYAEACEYIRQAAMGLQHAFEKGVVHRDIKPSNLLLTTTLSGQQIKILDFGLARFGRENLPTHKAPAKEAVANTPISERLTQAGAIMGTADFIAPEQAEDASQADIRSDLFSLGCTLFYLLTREHPFPGQDTPEKIRKRKYGDPIPVRNLRDDVPPELERVLLKMTARLAKNRYQTPAEVIAALEPFATEAAKPPQVVGASQRLNPSAKRDAQVGPSRTDESLRRRLKRPRRPQTWLERVQEHWHVVVWFGAAMLVFLFLAMFITSWVNAVFAPGARGTDGSRLPTVSAPSKAIPAAIPSAGDSKPEK
jgi:eukaryotic-like serine/threonine-protein kinase